MHGFKVDTEWQKKRPLGNIKDCLTELNLTTESYCLQSVREPLHLANLQVSHDLERFRANNEGMWNPTLQRRFVQEKILTNVKIRQVYVERFDQVQSSHAAQL